jgi:predicted PurR-regulated permease PerM
MLFSKDQPFYIRLFFKLSLIVLIGFIVYTEKVVLVPLYFSVLVAVLLLPLNNWLEKKGLHRGLASLVCVLVAFVVIISVVWFVSAQLRTFLQDMPTIRHNFGEHLNSIETWIQKQFHLSSEQRASLITNAKQGVKFPSSSYIGQTFLTLSQSLFLVVLVAIYSFLLLYYRHLIQKVIFSLYSEGHQAKVNEVIIESKHMVQKYMLGLVIEMLLVATVNSLALWIIGIPYAIFLGVFVAILNIIPYIGILTGMIFTVLVTLSTAANIQQILWIILSLWFIHLIDSNVLMPRIVGSRVKINALATIFGAVAGGSLIGIPGIFLALPTLAIMKIIFDRIDDMKPWGMLLGDERPHAPVLARKKKRKT